MSFFSAFFARSQVEVEIKKRMKAEATQDHLVRKLINSLIIYISDNIPLFEVCNVQISRMHFIY